MQLSYLQSMGRPKVSNGLKETMCTNIIRRMLRDKVNAANLRRLRTRGLNGQG